MEQGGSFPIEINAANEVAVDAFLSKKIKFTQISDLIELALSGAISSNINSIDDILAVDNEAKIKAKLLLKGTKFA